MPPYRMLPYVCVYVYIRNIAFLCIYIYIHIHIGAYGTGASILYIYIAYIVYTYLCIYIRNIPFLTSGILYFQECNIPDVYNIDAPVPYAPIYIHIYIRNAIQLMELPHRSEKNIAVSPRPKFVQIIQQYRRAGLYRTGVQLFGSLVPVGTMGWPS